MAASTNPREKIETVAVPLTPLQRQHMQARVESGDFRDEGEYLQRLIAVDFERIEALRAAIQEGLDSGVSDKSIHQIFEEAKQAHLEG